MTGMALGQAGRHGGRISDDRVTQGPVSLVWRCVPTRKLGWHVRGHGETIVRGVFLLWPQFDLNGFSRRRGTPKAKAKSLLDAHTHTLPVLHTDCPRVVPEDLCSVTNPDQSHPGISTKEEENVRRGLARLRWERSAPDAPPARETSSARQSWKYQIIVFLTLCRVCHFKLLPSESPKKQNTHNHHVFITSK